MHRTAVARATAPLAAALVGLAALLGGSVASAQLLDHPRRAPGLWEVRTVSAQAVGLEPTRQCVGRDTDTAAQHLDRSPGKRGVCEFGPYRRSGKQWVAESVCRRGHTVVKSRSVLSGDLDKAYRIDTVVRYDPPPGGRKREDREALEARRLGPCRKGQQPGDIVIPGIGTLNMAGSESLRGPD